MIWRLGMRQPDRTPFKGVVVAFALFFGLGGLGHFLDMVAFFYPMYRLSGLVLVATGLVACWTAWSLSKAWPSFLAMTSSAALEVVIPERTEDLARALDVRLAEDVGRAYLESTPISTAGKIINPRTAVVVSGR